MSERFARALRPVCIKEPSARVQRFRFMEYEIPDESDAALFDESSNPSLWEGDVDAPWMFGDRSADLDESLQRGVLIPEEEDQLG